MLRKLARNTVISAGAFFATSVVNLLLVPIVVQRYGLVEYGLITLARLFLPGGAISLLDFGYSETATQAVARARTDGNWREAGRIVVALLLVVGLVGCIVSVALGLAVPFLTRLLQAPAENAASFEWLLALTAVAFVPLFLSSVFEGTAKGFEAFPAIRTIEVLCAFVYATIAIGCISAEVDYFGIAVAYLASMGLRAVLMAGLAWRLIAKEVPQWGWPGGSDWQDVRRRGSVMAGSRLLGSLQHQLPSLIIGATLGPANAGIFDLLIRIPRFAKTVLAVLSNAVLPAAARLDHSGNEAGLRRLTEAGLVGVSLVSLPFIFGGVAFSAALLHIWAGPQFSALWVWQSLMFAVPLLNVFFSFGSATLLARPAIVARFNFIIAIQIALQFALALVTMRYLEERAFILGQAAAMMATFPFQMGIIARETGARFETWRRIGLIALICALGAGVTLLSGLPWVVRDTLHFAASGLAWLGACYFMIWFLCMTREERSELTQKAGLKGIFRRK